MLARLKRGTEKLDLCSNLAARNHRLPCDIGHGSTWAQTLARTQDAVRRGSVGNSCFGTFTRNQWFGRIFCHNWRRRGFSPASPLFAHMAYYSHAFGILVKGKPEIIVRDGECDFQMMRRNHVSVHDLEEDMRLNGNIDDLSQVRLARVERSGDISFIKK